MRAWAQLVSLMRLTDPLTGSLTPTAGPGWNHRPMATHPHRSETRAAGWFSFLAAFVAVLATLLSTASASAAAQSTAETRVRASAVVVKVPVGPPEHIRAGQRLGEAAPGRDRDSHRDRDLWRDVDHGAIPGGFPGGQEQLGVVAAVIDDSGLAGREELLDAINELLTEIDRGAEWENDTLELFLEAFGALLGSIEIAYTNTGRSIPDSPWTLAAEALRGARFYE